MTGHRWQLEGFLRVSNSRRDIYRGENRFFSAFCFLIKFTALSLLLITPSKSVGQMSTVEMERYLDSLPILVYQGRVFKKPVKLTEPAQYVFKDCVFPVVKNRPGETADALKLKHGRLTVVNCLFLGGQGSSVRCIRVADKGNSDAVCHVEIHGNTFLDLRGVDRDKRRPGHFDADYLVFQDLANVLAINITDNTFQTRRGRTGRVVKLQSIPSVRFVNNRVDVRWIKSGVVAAQTGSRCVVQKNDIRVYIHDFLVACGDGGWLDFSFNKIQLIDRDARVQDIVETKTPPEKIIYRRNDLRYSDLGVSFVELAKSHNIPDGKLVYEAMQ